MKGVRRGWRESDYCSGSGDVSVLVTLAFVMKIERAVTSFNFALLKIACAAKKNYIYDITFGTPAVRQHLMKTP